MTETERITNLYEMHKKLSTICGKMHTRGMHFIEENRACLEYMAREEMEEAIIKWKAVSGLPSDSKHTPAVMRALLFSRHAKSGIPCHEMPDPISIPDWTNPAKETVSVKKAPLLRLIVSPMATPEVVKIVDAWWKFKKAEKKVGFLTSKKMIADINIEDGVIRPPWNSCGTDTGRFSGSYIMTIPQDLRYMFGPAPGRAWIHVDKKQLEIRVMACVANDRVLQDIIKSGLDLYTEEAKRYFSLPPETTDKTIKRSLRQGAKIIRLSRQYAAEEKACLNQALNMDRTITISRIRTLMKLFDETYKDTVIYWGTETKRVAAAGYSESRIMRRRRFYPRMPDLSEIANWPIQATASDIMNTEYIQLDERLTAESHLDAHIITQLHDAVDVDCPEENIDKVIPIMKEIHDRNWVVNDVDFNFGVDLKVATHSQSWKGDTWAAL